MTVHTKRLIHGVKILTCLVLSIATFVGVIALAMFKPLYGVPIVLLGLAYVIGWTEEGNEDYQGW